MKKKLFTLLLALVAIATTARAQVVLNETNFPDANFRAALAEIFGIGEGDEITEAKIAATTTLKVNRKSIADLTGIEHFTALDYLSCHDNQLTSLDVSKNTALWYLYCINNQLTALDVSKNTALTWLLCNNNQLTSLDVSKNTALRGLYCVGNQLTALDVSKNTALTDLYCSGNQLTSLDVSKNTALTDLRCYGNQLTSLDVSKNTALTYLSCYGNQIKGEAMDALVASLPTVEYRKIYVIDTKDENEGNVCTKSQVAVAKGKGWIVYDYNGGVYDENYEYPEYEGSDDAAAKLLLNAENFPDANFRAALAEILGISEGDEITAEKIAATTSLNVSRKEIADLTGIEHFTALTGLRCDGNQLTSLDVSKNTALRNLWCNGNQLTLLDVSKNTALTNLRCNDNPLTSINVSLCSSLISLDCSKIGLTSLNASGCTALTGLECYSNQLTSLNVSGCTSLATLKCYDNQLTSLDVSDCTALQRLNCEENQLTSLDVSKNTALTVLGCGSNQLTSLDVSQNIALASLGCGKSQLTSLDVSKNTVLTSLSCKNNQLTTLDVSKNTALQTLYCEENQLTSLDVSKNTALTKLDCRYNQLTSLDVSKNTTLTELYCGTNQLTSLDVSGRSALKILSFSNNPLTSLDVSGCTSLTSLTDCYKIGLTSIDVSGCTALEYLTCSGNQLISLDVSDCTALQRLNCEENQLTSLDVSKNTALTVLGCGSNQLTSLDVSQNTALRGLGCDNNQLKDEAMDALVASLPTVENGEFYVIDTKDEKEGNVCTKSQVAVAKEKGWKVYDYNGGNYPYPEYEGSDPVEEDIDPVDEDDNIDFGNDMDENDDLDGNVIGDIFYNIGNGNGEYNAEEGCIVLKKTTDDETVDGLSGKDIFGEDFKGQFTGIVFKVPSGKGTVKVTAETTGNMLLKVKIGDGEPVEMELNGKLKISFPYNVSETTLVAIYAGANNEAKGLGTTNATEDAALKIYGIEFERDNTTAIDASLNDNGQRTNDSWYTIDGVKLNGEPTKKGIYIYNGKKVKK